MRKDVKANDLNRRSLLKKVGTTAGVGVLGANGVGLVSGAPSPEAWEQKGSDIEVTNATPLDQSQENQRLTSSVMSSKPVQKLAGLLQQRKDLQWSL
ncbi:twin-arginine translocation signal domain-containing protein, partial [Halococcus agarilyticus]|uniref:twin-arginine translocation signal domain-containing protein n=1 Tax=Halococcus agarilyticus TaxID=1232219 RepID=UPI0012AC3288